MGHKCVYESIRGLVNLCESRCLLREAPVRSWAIAVFTGVYSNFYTVSSTPVIILGDSPHVLALVLAPDCLY